MQSIVVQHIRSQLLADTLCYPPPQGGVTESVTQV